MRNQWRFAPEVGALTTETPGGGEEAHRRWPKGRSERGARKAKHRSPKIRGSCHIRGSFSFTVETAAPLTQASLLASLGIMQSAKAISLGTFEAKKKFSSLVDLASKGSRIWITKRGRRVALLSSGVEGGAKTDADLVAVFRKIRARSKSGKESLKSLIEEGRR